MTSPSPPSISSVIKEEQRSPFPHHTTYEPLALPTMNEPAYQSPNPLSQSPNPLSPLPSPMYGVPRGNEVGPLGGIDAYTKVSYDFSLPRVNVLANSPPPSRSGRNKQISENLEEMNGMCGKKLGILAKILTPAPSPRVVFNCFSSLIFESTMNNQNPIFRKTLTKSWFFSYVTRSFKKP